MDSASPALPATDLLAVTLEPYQQRAADWLACHRRGIVVASAGSGKTIIAAAAIQKVVLSKVRIDPVRVGWMANTIEQCNQARAALQQFPCCIQENVACAAAQMDWSDRDVLIVDECHHSSAETWTKQIANCRGARWGFSATPFRDDPDKTELVSALFDDLVYCVSRSEVSRRLVPATVIMLSASDSNLQEPIDREIEHTVNWRRKYWRGPEWELIAAVTWHVCIKRGIVNNRARNEAVIEIAKKHASDSVLVLVNQIEHGQALADRIPGAKLCHSKMGAKSRREALAAFKAGELRCLVATSLADEGLDVPIANVLVMVSGGRSSAMAEQRTGRVLRSFADKTHATIYDFIDRQHTTMAKHSSKRVATYRKLGYSVQFA